MSTDGFTPEVIAQIQAKRQQELGAEPHKEEEKEPENKIEPQPVPEPEKAEPEPTPDPEEDEVDKEIEASANQRLFGKTESKKEEEPVKTTGEIPKEVEEQLQRLTAYEELFNDSELAWAIQQRQQGKSIYEAFKEAAPIDVKKLSAEELYGIELKKYSAHLSEEEVAAEMERFKDLDKIEKLRLTQPIREQLEKEQAEKQRNFSADPEARKKQQEAEYKKQEELAKKYQDDLNNTISALKGQAFYGVTVDDKILKQISDETSKDGFPAIFKPDWTPDNEAMIELAILRTQMANILKVNIKKVKNETQIDMLKERRNVSLKDGTGAPITRGANDDSYEARKQRVLDGFGKTK